MINPPNQPTIQEYRRLKKEFEELQKEKNKKLQFSQKMTLISAIFSMMFVIAINSANFLLLWHDKQPMPQETITAMSIYGGITSTLTFGGYCTLSVVRDCSKNKLAAAKCQANAE